LSRPHNHTPHISFGEEYAVIMRGISKSFPDVVANDNVDLAVRRGEIHGLLGENGAGKTVLMSILAGIYKPDSGEIYVNGERVVMDSPATAIKHGIGMVHQHFMLIPSLTVLENIILGNEPSRWGFVNIKEAEQQLRELQEKHRLYVNLHEVVAKLPIGLQQRVEILKTLYRRAEILILDEPTSVLTPEEVENLFQIINGFRRGGKTVIFITHKLREALEVCDRITVLRRGRVVGTVSASEASPQTLAEMMIGKRLTVEAVQKSQSAGRPVLLLRGVEVYNEKNVRVLKGIDLDVRSGEILGIAGVEGNGQTELVETIVGLRVPEKGSIMMGGLDITRMPISARRELGLAYIPEDRQQKALILDFSVAENMILGQHRKPPFSKGLLLKKRAIEKYADTLKKEYDIRVSQIYGRVGNLSGGNQQKVVLARELTRIPKVVVASHPTRGLDIAATEYVHSKLVEMRNRGSGVLLVSADLDEILKLSDRVAVMYEGRIVAVRHHEEAEKKEIGLLMGGGG